MADPDDIRTYLVAQLRDLAILEPDEEAGDDLALLGSGLLDSYGFVALLTGAEDHFGLEVDLTLLDPSEFSTLGGIVACLAAAP